MPGWRHATKVALAQQNQLVVVVEHDATVPGHLYVERQVVPLNLYLKSAGAAAARSVIIDLGYAIKDLAYTNVFPGDLLTKNFGVTRNGRVV
ncbi:MAG: isocitrate dehydrogenase kinase/phosphatase-domain containing protein, partial [Myxococcota bacterium]